MKLKERFEVVPLQGDYVAVPLTGEAKASLHGVIRFNETGAFIWNAIRDGADTEEKILAEMRLHYEDLDEKTAREDLALFMKTAAVALEP